MRLAAGRALMGLAARLHKRTTRKSDWNHIIFNSTSMEGHMMGHTALGYKVDRQSVHNNKKIIRRQQSWILDFPRSAFSCFLYAHRANLSIRFVVFPNYYRISWGKVAVMYILLLHETNKVYIHFSLRQVFNPFFLEVFKVHLTKRTGSLVRHYSGPSRTFSIFQRSQDD